jgi:uncharacterized protein (DUF952 family)
VTKIFEEHEARKKYPHLYDDKTIENMKQYFKLEYDYDALFKYIKANRILHEELAEP